MYKEGPLRTEEPVTIMVRTLAFFTFLCLLPSLSGSADEQDESKGAESGKRATVEPKCPYHVKKAAPRARVGAQQGPGMMSMPEFFMKMGQTFASNPSGGFKSVLDELAGMEGPALEGIKVSVAEERESGLRARDEYLRQAAERGYRTVRDGPKLARTQALVDKFTPLMKHRDRYPRIDVLLIDAPIPDGQSFPGGYLVFTTALLDEPTEDSMAGVVAHELAHLDLGHLYNYAKRGKFAETAYSSPPGAGATFDQFFTKQMALFGLLMNPYRPEHELEADCLAVSWMYRQGYEPTELAGFFERLHRGLGDRPDDPNFGFSLGRSHPYSLDRKVHVERRYAQLRKAK
jgi:hypothetical protein